MTMVASAAAHPPAPIPKLLAPLELRLAATPADIGRAQKLRYRVFFREGGGRAAPAARNAGRDLCRFDEICDHLLVVDPNRRTREGEAKLVGACRVLRDDVAAQNFGFYSAGEFDVGAMIARHANKKFLELGRACVARKYRGKGVVELMWRGVLAYARRHRIDVVFGCASLPGANSDGHCDALGALVAIAPAAETWRAEPMSNFSFPIAAAPSSAARRALPPLIKSYLRAGAQFGRHAVPDAAFGVTDIFAVLPLAQIEHRYRRRFDVWALSNAGGLEKISPFNAEVGHAARS